jgi:hypothetical protein
MLLLRAPQRSPDTLVDSLVALRGQPGMPQQQQQQQQQYSSHSRSPQLTQYHHPQQQQPLSYQHSYQHEQQQQQQQQHGGYSSSLQHRQQLMPQHQQPLHLQLQRRWSEHSSHDKLGPFSSLPNPLQQHASRYTPYIYTIFSTFSWWYFARYAVQLVV